MGITIHYRGTLDKPERVQDLQQELADIATSMGWSSRLLNDDWARPPSATLVHDQGIATRAVSGKQAIARRWKTKCAF